jgi:hypothetical protein
MASSVAAGCLGAADGATTVAGEIETTAVSEVTVGSGAMAVMEVGTEAEAETAE